MPEARGRTGPEVRRAGEMPHPLTAATLERPGPAPHLGSTTGSALLAEMWVSQPRIWESGGAVSPTHLPCDLPPHQQRHSGK